MSLLHICLPFVTSYLPTGPFAFDCLLWTGSKDFGFLSICLPYCLLAYFLVVAWLWVGWDGVFWILCVCRPKHLSLYCHLLTSCGSSDTAHIHMGEPWNLQRIAKELLSPNSFRITTCTEAGCLKIQQDIFCKFTLLWLGISVKYVWFDALGEAAWQCACWNGLANLSMLS